MQGGVGLGVGCGGVRIFVAMDREVCAHSWRAAGAQQGAKQPQGGKGPKTQERTEPTRMGWGTINP